MTTDDLDMSTLDPGIRRTVAWLRSLEFDTTDSGDGVTKVGEMECALAFPHVVMLPHRSGCPVAMAECAQRLRAVLEGMGITVEPGMIQASYDPVDGSAVVMLSEIDDSKLPAVDS